MLIEVGDVAMIDSNSAMAEILITLFYEKLFDPESFRLKYEIPKRRIIRYISIARNALIEKQLYNYKIVYSKMDNLYYFIENS